MPNLTDNFGEESLYQSYVIRRDFSVASICFRGFPVEE